MSKKKEKPEEETAGDTIQINGGKVYPFSRMEDGVLVVKLRWAMREACCAVIDEMSVSVLAAYQKNFLSFMDRTEGDDPYKFSQAVSIGLKLKPLKMGEPGDIECAASMGTTIKVKSSTIIRKASKQMEFDYVGHDDTEQHEAARGGQ